MELVTVTPLTYTAQKGDLSYYTNRSVETGNVVLVPIRNTLTPALVVKTESLKKAKARIRTSSYGLKKVEKIITPSLFSSAALSAARETVHFYATSLGSTLKVVTPQTILEDPPYTDEERETKQRELKPETLVLQAPQEERILFYKQHVREVLAQGGTILLCVPTKRDARYLKERLTKGIEHVTHVVHGDLTAKMSRAAWSELSKDGAKLVISTGLFLTAHFPRIDTVIQEHESSASYYTARRPFIDIGFFIEELARASGARFIKADTILSMETLKRHKDGELGEVISLQNRYHRDSSVSIVDMTEETESETKNKHASFLSTAVLTALKNTAPERSFIFTARRGLSPTTTCGDCGFTFSCDQCSAPLVLHGKEGNRRFICHTCGNTEKPRDLCPHCKSWRIQQLGIASERIAEIVQEVFPDRAVIRIDSDTASTANKEEKLMKRFLETPGSILVGTELAANLLRVSEVSVPTIAVASIDSLLTFPNYSTGEKVFSTLMELSLTAETNFLVQTRVPQQGLLAHLQQGTIMNFYQEELDIRKQLSYPPYSVPITVTFSGIGGSVNTKQHELEERFASFEPVFFPSISEKKRGHSVRKMLIRRPKAHWPDDDLSAHLLSLPPEYKVAVHPPIII